MEQADRAEEESIRRFRRFEAMWAVVAEAMREAEARRRLDAALDVLRAERPAARGAR
jgi:hypothetical protein